MRKKLVNKNYAHARCTTFQNRNAIAEKLAYIYNHTENSRQNHIKIRVRVQTTV